MALLVLGELAVRVSPEWWPWLSPFGLTYGWGWWLLLAGTIARAVTFKWWRAVGPSLVLCLTWPSFSLVFSLGSGTTPVEDASKGLGVLSFNVRRLDEYGWLKGEETRRELSQWLMDREEHIWCLQEFPLNGRAMLQKAGFSWAMPSRKLLAWPSGAGPAVVTDLPVKDWSTWMFPQGAGRGRVVQVDVETRGGVVRIFNVHLQSLYFSEADYEAVEEGPSREEGLRLLGLLTQAYEARAAQVQELKRRMEESPYPVLVAGDFNDSPMSYAMRSLRKSRVSDTFSAGEFGWQGTHIGTLPGLRIDGVLADTVWQSRSHQTHDVELSDHRPVTVLLERK